MDTILEEQTKMKKIEIEIGELAIIDMLELPEHGIVMADYGRRLLVLDIDDPSVQKDEIVLDGIPYGVTGIDNHTVGISVGHKCIQMLDMRTRTTTQTIKVDLHSDVTLWGLAYVNGDFFMAAKDKIVQVSENSQLAEDILTFEKGWIFYVQIHDGKLYFTNYMEGSFICASLRGEILFEYRTSKMKGPYGITKINDKFGIADWLSNRIHIIDNDGSESRIYMGNTDGAYKPRVLMYENKHNYLLIACNGGKSLIRRTSMAL